MKTFMPVTNVARVLPKIVVSYTVFTVAKFSAQSA